jgi:hypothetical protein
MATIQTTTNPGLIEEGKHSAVNWGAWADSGVSAATFRLGAGLFLIAVAMLSSTIGGFIAGPFSHNLWSKKARSGHSREQPT